MRGPLVAEGFGTALLLYVIVGSGIAAETLSGDGGVQLLAHAVIVGLGLGVLVAMFQTVSRSHFNPSVTLAFWRTGDIQTGPAAGYVLVQVGGAALGVILANLSFARPAVAISQTARIGTGLIIAEAIATFALVLVILALVRTGRPAMVPAAVGAWVAAIVFATSSTGFANPAVTLSRILTDSYTGIAPASAIFFLIAQLVAGGLAAPAATLLYPQPAAQTTT